MLNLSSIECCPPKDKWAPRLRPEVVTDHGKPISVDGLHSHGWHGQKGLHITPSWDLLGRRIHCPLVTVRNTLLGRISADPGGHVDGGFFDGGWDDPIDFFMENTTVYGVQAGQMNLLWTGGKFRTIWLKNVRVFGAGNSPMFDARVGPIGTIIIEDSPGLTVVLQGPPKSIGNVFVGPGVKVKENYLPAFGWPGANLVNL